MESKVEVNVPERFIYRIKDTIWQQEPLLFKDDARVLKMLNDANVDFSKGIMGSLTQVVNLPLIPDLFKIILKPYHETFLKGLANKFLIWKNKVDTSNPAGSMNNMQVREVLRDFFYFNVSLLVNSSGLGEILALINQNQVEEKEAQTSPSTT
jgi:hypothetical protein